MRTILIIALATLLAGCPNTKPDVPRGVIIKPQAVTVTRTVYVNVPANLTDQLPIAEGALAICPDVAAARREALKTANARFKSIRALSGTEAKP